MFAEDIGSRLGLPRQEFGHIKSGTRTADWKVERIGAGRQAALFGFAAF